MCIPGSSNLNTCGIKLGNSSAMSATIRFCADDRSNPQLRKLGAAIRFVTVTYCIAAPRWAGVGGRLPAMATGGRRSLKIHLTTRIIHLSDSKVRPPRRLHDYHSGSFAIEGVEIVPEGANGQRVRALA